MSARIVFTTGTPGPTVNTVSQPIQHSVDAADRVSAQKLIASNVGGSTAVNCGFYITAVGEDVSNQGLEDLTEILSWAYGGGTNGVTTITGAEVVTFEALAAANLFVSTANRHNYEQGVNVLNKIALDGADGTEGDELRPNTSSTFYIFVRIPAAEPSALYNFSYHLYYEEVV